MDIANIKTKRWSSPGIIVVHALTLCIILELKQSSIPLIDSPVVIPVTFPTCQTEFKRKRFVLGRNCEICIDTPESNLGL